MGPAGATLPGNSLPLSNERICFRTILPTVPGLGSLRAPPILCSCLNVERALGGAAALVHPQLSHAAVAMRPGGRGGERLSPGRQADSQPPCPGHKSNRVLLPSQGDLQPRKRGSALGRRAGGEQELPCNAIPWGDGGPAGSTPEVLR